MNEIVTDSAKPSGAEDEVKWLKKQLGEQGNQIGQLRSALEAKIDEQDRALVLESFDSDQVHAMERLVDQKMAPVQQKLNESSMAQAEAKLVTKHPDYQAVQNSPEFNAWLEGSRRNMAAYEIAAAGDIDTGIELLDAFKSEVQHEPTGDVLNTALASNRGSSGDAGIREGGVLLRTEIQHLKTTDPAAYRARLPEIHKAYAEGRVR